MFSPCWEINLPGLDWMNVELGPKTPPSFCYLVKKNYEVFHLNIFFFLKVTRDIYYIYRKSPLKKTT